MDIQEIINEFDKLNICDKDLDILINSFQNINISNNFDNNELCDKINNLEINEKIKSQIIEIIYRKKCLMPIIHTPIYVI